MSKSIKYKNNFFLDSSSVMHKNEDPAMGTSRYNLKKYLNTLDCKVTWNADVNTYAFENGLTYMYNPSNAPGGTNGFLYQISWGFSKSPNGYGCQFSWAYSSNQLYFRVFYEGKYTGWTLLSK